MTTERQQRLQALTEQNYVRLKLPLFLSHVGKALDLQITERDLLSLSASRDVRERADGQIKEAFSLPASDRHLIFGPQEGSTFDSEWARFLRLLQEEATLLSLGAYQQFPLVKLMASSIAPRFYELCRVGGPVGIYSRNANKGISADWYPDDQEWTFEIASWGIS